MSWKLGIVLVSKPEARCYHDSHYDAKLCQINAKRRKTMPNDAKRDRMMPNDAK